MDNQLILPNTTKCPSRVDPAAGFSANYRAPIPLIREPLYRPNDLDMTGMKILSFYFNDTSTSFNIFNGSDADREGILRGPVVQQAFDVPFLMDMIFALSINHMEVLGQVDSTTAYLYRAKAMSSFREAVHNRQKHAYAALALGSLLMIPVSSSQFRDKTSDDLPIIQWLHLMKGVKHIITLVTRATVTNNGIGMLFDRPEMDLDTGIGCVPSDLVAIFASIQPGDQDYEDLTTYTETLACMGTLYRHLSTGYCSLMMLRILSWFTFVPDKFTELVQKRRPRALIIIAFYGMFLKLSPNVWWMDGVGDRTVSDVVRRLVPGPFDHVLRIPASTIGVHEQDEIFRIINSVNPSHQFSVTRRDRT